MTETSENHNLVAAYSPFPILLKSLLCTNFVFVGLLSRNFPSNKNILYLFPFKSVLT